MKVLSVFLLLFSYYSYGNQSCESYTNDVSEYSSLVSEKHAELSRNATELRRALNDFNQAKRKEEQSKRHFINYKGKGLHNWIQDREALAEAHCKLIKTQAQAEILPEQLKYLQESLRRAQAGRDKYCQQSRYQPTPPQIRPLPARSSDAPPQIRPLPARPSDAPPQIRPLPARPSDVYQLQRLKN